jgi:hypothetical protein
MEDDTLLKITQSMEEKLGKDASATIADDIGLLISENEKTKATIKEQGEHIEKLRADKEKLVLANGNLLKQIPMGTEEMKKEVVEEKPSSRIDLASCFDKAGMFKR